VLFILEMSTSCEAKFAKEATVAVVKIIHSAVPENPEGGLFSEDDLAVAMVVNATAEDEFIYVAIEYDPDSKPPLQKNRRFRMYSCIALVIVLCVVVIVVVNITKSTMADEVVSLRVNYTSHQRPIARLVGSEIKLKRGYCRGE
jgi:uncharacterized BrkB/YihY/UPF0761 family membrane protein